MTGVTVMVSVALVDCAGDPLSVPRTTNVTGPKKSAAGEYCNVPSPRIVAVPEAGAVTMLEKVTVCSDSLAGPGEKTEPGRMMSGDAESSVTVKLVPITTGASLTGVTLIVTVPVA